MKGRDLRLRKIGCQGQRPMVEVAPLVRRASSMAAFASLGDDVGVIAHKQRQSYCQDLWIGAFGGLSTT